MYKWPIERKIKYESELDASFVADVSACPGGELLFSCIQCGTCSATCPLSIYMDYTPRRIIAMTRAGFQKEVLGSFTIWLCASCYSCTVECPKEIKITDIMYALKQRAIDQRFYPNRFPIPVLAREFFALILDRGRNSESRLLVRLYLKTNPFRMFSRAWLGVKLLMRGRLKFGSDSIKNRRQLQTILKSIDSDVHHQRQTANTTGAPK